MHVLHADIWMCTRMRHFKLALHAGFLLCQYGIHVLLAPKVRWIEFFLRQATPAFDFGNQLCASAVHGLSEAKTSVSPPPPKGVQGNFFWIVYFVKV